MDKWILTDKFHALAKETLESWGFEVDWQPNISNEELLEIIHKYYGIIISTKTRIDKQLIDRAENLKVVGRVGSGMEHVDQIYLKEKGIACFNSPEGNCNAVAEHSLAMLLTLANNLMIVKDELKAGVWRREENRGFELKGRTIAIIGYGHTGSAFARKLSGFDCKVMAYDKYKSGFSDEYVEECSYETILENAEVISFHIPYNQETHHWINRSFIESCNDKVVLINTSRGAIANTKDLLLALENDKIKGLCLDVFEDEPINAGKINQPDLYRKILKFNNVVASPHIAGWSIESKTKLVSELMSKIEESLIKQS